ncbi:MAG: MotA/TolQ/ExbB proton channel family protein [Pirellulaceae bacterium]|nr:MotA/TolQ/ExbB proton channel family protein [Pirellulaceae bacterium]
MIKPTASNSRQGSWNFKRMLEIKLGTQPQLPNQVLASMSWALVLLMFVPIATSGGVWAAAPPRLSARHLVASAPFVSMPIQESTSAPVAPVSKGESPASDPAEDSGLVDETTTTTPPRSMLQMMFTGNPFGVAIVVLILLLSIISCILIVENAISLRSSRLLPPDVMQALESALALRDTRAAMMICNDIDNQSMATQVVLAGLERFRSSEFGFAEYRSAVEEAGEHITGRLYRKVEILNVIASIAPMLGLMGTVIGMIDAFNTIAAKQGVAGPEDLAGGIGQALITTLLGLVVAVPTMVAFSYFRTRIDALVSEAGTRIERLMLPLGRRKSSP